MKTGHLLIICGTVIVVAWLAFLPFRYQVHWKEYDGSGTVYCYYLDALTGQGGHHKLPNKTDR